MSTETSKSATECVRAAQEHAQQGDRDQALFLFGRAAELDRSWAACRPHAHALYCWNELDSAAACLEAFLRDVDAVCGSALNDLGVIKAELGQRAAAMSCFKNALRAQQGVSPALVLGNLAHVLYLDARFAECIRISERALQFEPGGLRPQYLITAAEAERFEGRVRPVADAVEAGERLHAFRAMLFSDEPARELKARIPADQKDVIQLAEPCEMSRCGSHWGVYFKVMREVWCGFAVQCRDAGPDARPEIAVPNQLALVQRRRWVRVNSTQAIARMVVESLPEGAVPPEIVDLNELNLSATGAAIRTDPLLPPETCVSLTLNLGDGVELEVPARVVRICNPPNADPYMALALHHREDKHRDHIARYLHQVQLERKKRRN